MKCSICGKYFQDNPNGLSAKTFHEILHDGET